MKASATDDVMILMSRTTAQALGTYGLKAVNKLPHGDEQALLQQGYSLLLQRSRQAAPLNPTQAKGGAE